MPLNDGNGAVLLSSLTGAAWLASKPPYTAPELAKGYALDLPRSEVENMVRTGIELVKLVSVAHSIKCVTRGWRKKMDKKIETSTRIIKTVDGAKMRCYERQVWQGIAS